MEGISDYGVHGSSIGGTENLSLQASKDVEKWFLMGSPWPVFSIVSCYLAFVLKFGPKWMKNRQPYNIRYIMLIYNLYQTIYNGYIVAQMFTTSGAISYLWKHSCVPLEPAINPYHKYMNISAWHYFFSKVMDLLDTVFFVLRKKQSHITFLHVYHHTNMVLCTWTVLKYIKGEQGVIAGWLNAIVHVVMYSYYFLSALGPQMQKYLWWKRYITRMQMIQFIMIIVYMSSLLLAKCELPKSFTFFIIFQGVTFLILFTNFYVKSYVKTNPSANKIK